jgi:hypothetical protein
MNALVPTPVRLKQPPPAVSDAEARAVSLDDLFSAEEWRYLHAQDKLAGGAIVAIMITIFSLGLIGYTAIALLSAGG